MESTSGEASLYYDKTFKQNLTNHLSGFCLRFVEGRTQKNSKAETLAVSAVLSYPSQTMLHCDVLIEGATQFCKQDWAYDLAKQVKNLDSASFAVDANHCDQILIYCAIAKGQSQFTTQKDLSLHTQTMLTLLPMFCPV